MAVYPRWRGEHYAAPAYSDRRAGLSPLVRGTRPSALSAVLTRRFIPAGAGNTAPRLYHPSFEPVYPRWRGEHTKRMSLFINYFLSAPHSTNIIATI